MLLERARSWNSWIELAVLITVMTTSENMIWQMSVIHLLMHFPVNSLGQSSLEHPWCDI